MLALLMTLSVLTGFDFATVYAVQQPPPTTTAATNNPYVTGGRIRSTEVVSLNWDQAVQSTVSANTNVSGGRTATSDCESCGAEPEPSFGFGGGLLIDYEPEYNPFFTWLLENGGYYNTVLVEVRYGETVRRLYRRPHQGSFVFSTNQQTNHQQLSRDNFNHTISYFPMGDDIVVKHYQINSFVPLPSGHFVIPYNLFWSFVPVATGGASNVSPGQGAGIWTVHAGGMMISYITTDNPSVDWYIEGQFLDAGVPGYRGEQPTQGHRTRMDGVHSALQRFDVSGPMSGNGHGWDSWGTLPGYQYGHFSPPLAGLNANLLSIRGRNGSATPIRNLLGTAPREVLANYARQGVINETTRNNWQFIYYLLVEMGSPHAAGVNYLLENERRPPDLPQIIIVFEPVIAFTQANNSHAATTVNNLRRMLNLPSPSTPMPSSGAGQTVFPNHTAADSSGLARLLHWDEGAYGYAEGINTLFSFFPEGPTFTPQFDCVMAGFEDSKEEWEWNRPSWWTSTHATVVEWNQYVADVTQGIDLDTLTPEEIRELEWYVSSLLWERWAGRGMMNMFVHPQHGALPGGTGNGLAVVMAAVEPICGAPKQDVTVTSADILALGGGTGLSQEVLDCITELSITIDWPGYGDQSPFDCTDPEEIPLWEEWAFNLGVQLLLAEMQGIDPADKEPPPEECTLPKDPPPGDCTPWDFQICGSHECYDYNRGDNTDEQDQGTTGLQDEESLDLRWNNIAFAFAETHMATSGFNNAGPSTPATTINLTRTSEVFQAMAGMPETEFLYINVGGREGAFDVEYTWHRRVYQFAVWWVESDYCPLFCEATVVSVCDDCGGCCCGEEGCPGPASRTDGIHNNTERSPVGTMHSDWGRTWEHSDISALPTSPFNPINETIELDGPGVFRHNEDYAQADFRFLEIRHGQARSATQAQVHNAHLYRTATPSLVQTPITLQDVSTNINNEPRPIEPGVRDTHHYGTDGNLSMFEYKWFAGHWHTEGKPSPRCFNDTSEAPVFRWEEATAHALATEQLGNLFAWNANLVFLLGVNTYQFVTTGGHGSGGPVLVGGPGGENLVEGPVANWHDNPYPNPVEVHAAPTANYFAPRGEQWHEYNIVPVSGFQGRNHRMDASRNGRPGQNPVSVSGPNAEHLIAWHNPSTHIVYRLHNNIYNFVPFLQYNWLNYTTYELVFGDSIRDILTNPEWQNMIHQHHPQVSWSPGDHLIAPNHVRLEYTAWQEPSSPYTIPQGPHTALTNPTAYMGPNPVIIHNPVASIFAWVHDVPSFTLQDQRINTVREQMDGGIVPHPRRLDYNAAARLYVDFDFRITIPNDGTFNTYWHFEPAQSGHPQGRERWSQQNSRFSPLNNDYIGGGSVGLGLDGRRAGGIPAPASGLVTFDPAPMVHNTGYSQLGLRGPGWVGDMQPWHSVRNHANPYQQLGTRQHPTAGWSQSPPIWDVSKWIAGKYIQFPFDVYFYGTFVPFFNPLHPGSQAEPSIIYGPFTQFQNFQGPGHPGGTAATFVPAGTWITLYNTNTAELAGPNNDPTEFAFRIPSHVADLVNQEIRIVTRSINSPSSNPNDLWYGGSEWNINAMRLPQGTGTRNTASYHPTGSTQDQEAFHSTATVLTVDIIGRIGNVLVDDNADPQWTNVFWNTDTSNRPLTNSPVWRAIGQHYNMFESVQNPGGLNERPWHPRNSAAGGIFNRFSNLSQWHGMDATLLYQEHHGVNQPYTLPLERNPQPQYSLQVTSLGYEFQFSVQTIGRFGDGEMWVHPRYILLGDWATHPGGDQAHFQMFATNPFDPTGVRQMFWDSAVPFANWQFGSTGPTRQSGNMTQNNWQPHFHHQLWHSLADPRAKVNTMERETFSFNEAVRRGQNYRWHLGDPSFIRIPTELRTHQGGPGTKGRIGEGIHYGYIESSVPSNWANQGHVFFGGPGQGTWGGRPIGQTPEGSPLFGDHGSNWENAHRWHARHHLPPSTEIIFHANMPYNVFEGRTDNQYIGVNFTFRTHGDNGLWDLSTYTGASNAQPYGSSLDAPPHERHLNPPDNLRPIPNRPGRNRARNWWLRPSAPPEADRGDPYWVEPNDPIIVFDYSRPAQSDRITIGTH